MSGLTAIKTDLVRQTLTWVCNNEIMSELYQTMTSSPDPHGQAALMLCESLAYLLVEQGVVGKHQMIDAIEGVIELKYEMAGSSEPAVVSITSIILLRGILDSVRAMSTSQSAARNT